MYGGGGVDDEPGREAGAGALPGNGASPSPLDQAMTSRVVSFSGEEGWDKLTDTDTRFEQTVIQ